MAPGMRTLSTRGRDGERGAKVRVAVTVYDRGGGAASATREMETMVAAKESAREKNGGYAMAC